MKTETEIKYELLNYWANISRKWITIKEYWEIKLLDEIFDYVKKLSE